jgi:hypothetical protein
VHLLTVALAAAAASRVAVVYCRALSAVRHGHTRLSAGKVARYTHDQVCESSVLLARSYANDTKTSRRPTSTHAHTRCCAACAAHVFHSGSPTHVCGHLFGNRDSQARQTIRVCVHARPHCPHKTAQDHTVSTQERLHTRPHCVHTQQHMATITALARTVETLLLSAPLSKLAPSKQRHFNLCLRRRRSTAQRPTCCLLSH